MYNIAQDLRIRHHFGDTLTLLRQTLDAHRVAQVLAHDDADVHFNTAQVLVSLAEEIDEDDASTAYLQEAIELFDSCLSKQELDYENAKVNVDSAYQEQGGQGGGVSLDAAETIPPNVSVEVGGMADGEAMEDASIGEGVEEEEYAMVVEPITAAALLDTALAQLNAFRLLLDYTGEPPRSPQGPVEEMAAVVLAKIPRYIQLREAERPRPGDTLHDEVDPKQELADSEEAYSIVAHYHTAAAEARYRCRKSNINSYREVIESSFAAVPQAGWVAVATHADAWINFASALLTPWDAPPLDRPTISSLRWAALKQAQDLLGKAIAKEGAEKIQLFVGRGDVDLHRFNLASQADAAESIQKTASVLLKNAGVYYRNAANLARQAAAQGELVDELAEASVKAVVIKMIASAIETPLESERRLFQDEIGSEKVLAILAEMTREELISADIAERMRGL